jgi:hypothetical protein
MTGTFARHDPVRRCSHVQGSSPGHGARHGQQARHTRIRRHSVCSLNTAGAVRTGWAIVDAGHVEAWPYFSSNARVAHGHAQSGWSTARGQCGGPLSPKVWRSCRTRVRRSPHPRGRARQDPRPRGWARRNHCPRGRARRSPSWLGRIGPQPRSLSFWMG